MKLWNVSVCDRDGWCDFVIGMPSSFRATGSCLITRVHEETGDPRVNGHVMIITPTESESK